MTYPTLLTDVDENGLEIKFYRTIEGSPREELFTWQIEIVSPCPLHALVSATWLNEYAGDVFSSSTHFGEEDRYLARDTPMITFSNDDSTFDTTPYPLDECGTVAFSITSSTVDNF